MGFSDFFNRAGEKKQPSANEIAAFIMAATTGDERAVRKFCKRYPDHVDAPDNNGQTALCAAARNNHVGTAEILLAAKADPNKPGVFGESPFLVRVALSFHDRDDYRLLDLLLKSGANVNFQQRAWAGEGLRQEETLITPLMEAAALLDEKLCAFLLKNGANPLPKDAKGKTARGHVGDFPVVLSSGAPGGVAERIAALLEKSEKEWATRPPADEWRGKVTPSNWQGH